MSEVLDFEYVDLREVDPSPEKLPDNVYEVQVVKAELQSGVSKSTGKPYQRVQFTLAVQNDPQFAGRRLFESLFPNDYGLKALRRIMDATGIEQKPGQPLTEWLNELRLSQASFKVHVRLEDDIDYATKEPRIGVNGEPAKRNTVNWFRVMPA